MEQFNNTFEGDKLDNYLQSKISYYAKIEKFNSEFEKDKLDNYVAPIFRFEEDEWDCYLVWYLNRKACDTIKLSPENTMLNHYSDLNHDHIHINNSFGSGGTIITNRSKCGGLYDMLLNKDFPRQLLQAKAPYHRFLVKRISTHLVNEDVLRSFNLDFYPMPLVNYMYK